MGHHRLSSAQEKLRKIKVRETTWRGTERRIKEIKMEQKAAEMARQKRAKLYGEWLLEAYLKRHPQENAAGGQNETRQKDPHAGIHSEHEP